MTNLRETTYKKADFYDTMLILLDMNGRPKKSVTISNADTLYSTFIANNGLIMVGSDHYWAGWSEGFSTRKNTLKKTGTGDFDVFTYKYNFDMEEYNCLWSAEYDSQAIKAVQDLKSQSEIASNGIYELFEDDDKVRKSRKS